MLRQQIEAVFEELHPRAVKTGMLFSAENVPVVAEFFETRTIRPRVPLIVDPVMVSTSGAKLLEPAAIENSQGKTAAAGHARHAEFGRSGNFEPAKNFFG